MNEKKANVFDSLNNFRVKHEPELLMGMGITGLLFSTVWAVKATVKAVKICEEKKVNENKNKLTVKEIIGATWKVYIPVVASTLVSVPCIIASNRVSSKRNAALAAAYTISETALQEYQTKAKEVVGEKKEKQIRDAVSQSQVDKTPTATKEIVLNEDDEQLFFEPLSGRYFKSSWNKIQEACNTLNERTLGSTTGAYSVNDWFEAIGLPETDTGDMLGWCTPTFGCSQGLMRISLSANVTKDNKPCGAIQYDVRPYPVNQFC